MFFTSEKIGDKIRLIRGYKSRDDKNYCTALLLCGDKNKKYEIKGFLSSSTLSVSEIKDLAEYLESLGLELYANVLKHDFERFYSKQSFKKLQFEAGSNKTPGNNIHQKSTSFEDAFRETLWLEGGHVDDPDDPGGETRLGISKKSYPDVDIAALTIDQAKEIYRRDYWNKIRLAEVFSSLVSGEIFDTAVNMGRRTSISIAQRALNFLGENLVEDGIIGDKTIAALNKWSGKDERALFVCLNGFQFMHYRLITKNNRSLMKFSRGWTKRIQQYQST